MYVEEREREVLRSTVITHQMLYSIYIHLYTYSEPPITYVALYDNTPELRAPL